MLDTIDRWDRELLLFLNGLGNESFDSFWLAVTKPQSWVLLYLLIFYLIFAHFGRTRGAIASVTLILTAFLANLCSSLLLL